MAESPDVDGVNSPNETRHCPECDWWVPPGMEYLYPEHKAEHDSRLPMWYFDAKRWVSLKITMARVWWHHGR